MTIEELLSTMTDRTQIIIHDSTGIELYGKSNIEDVPEFILEYTVGSVDIREHHTVSIVTKEESLLLPIHLIQANVDALYDLGDCHSYANAVCTVAERLHDLAETAEEIADMIMRGVK